MNVPEGFKQNSQGNLVPLSKISAVDLLRDDVVLSLAAAARVQADALRRFKISAMGDIESFIALSAEQYGVELGGVKGNVTLRSFDGRYKIQRAIAEILVFDERLQVAKQLINECFQEWGKGANENLWVVFNDAFAVDKEGNISTAKVLALRRYDIQDEKWRKAMDIISDSIEVADTKPYLRIYERQADGGYKRISLDIAGA